MKKNVLIFILLLAVCLLAWLYINKPAPRDTSPIEQQAKENVKLEAEIISRKVDEKGIERAIIEETDHVLTQAGLKNATDSAGIIDSLRMLLDEERGARRRALASYTQAQAEVARLRLAMEETDTSYTYRDSWLHVDVRKSSPDSPPLLTHRYNAELNWMWYTEQRRLLGFIPLGSKTYGQFWLNDPNARVLGVKHLRIEPPVKQVGFSLQAVGDYSPSGDVYGGFGATLRAGRVRLQGAYLSDFQGEWRPSFRGSYDLIEF